MHSAIVHPSPCEASYASPVLSPTMAEAFCHKRTHRSSVDKACIDGFEEEDLRAGGPNLCDAPCYCLDIPRDHNLYDALHVKDEHRDAILTMAEQSNIAVSDLSFVNREPAKRPSSPVPTILLTVYRENPTDRGWADFACKVWRYLDSRGMGEVAVELLDERFDTRPYIFPCKSDDDIYPIWGNVCGEILARVGLNDILSVGCHRMGNEESRDSCMPHILVAVLPESRRDWSRVRDEIVGILMEFHLHSVGVIIRRDTSPVDDDKRFTNGLLPEDCTSEVSVGSSIGMNGSQDPGTLGGFIELKNPSTGKWEEFALTCYHCTIPNDKEEERYSEKDVQVLSDWNRHGVGTTDKNASRLLIMDSPTQRDIQDGISGLENVISSVENAAQYQEVSRAMEKGEYVKGPEMAIWKRHNKFVRAYNADKEYMQGYLDQGRYRLGTVFAASGFREVSSTVNLNPTMLPTVRDWALIRPFPGRSLGKNKVSQQYIFEWTGWLTGQFAELSKLRHVEKMELLARERKLDSSWILHKFGRQTGDTTGRYNGLANARIARSYVDGKWEDRITWEHTVVSNDSKEVFCMPRDCGALVYTVTGEVVGMCCGSPKHGNVGYFSHIHDILDDIERITGVKDIRLKQ